MTPAEDAHCQQQHVYMCDVRAPRPMPFSVHIALESTSYLRHKCTMKQMCDINLLKRRNPDTYAHPEYRLRCIPQDLMSCIMWSADLPILVLLAGTSLGVFTHTPLPPPKTKIKYKSRGEWH